MVGKWNQRTARTVGCSSWHECISIIMALRWAVILSKKCIFSSKIVLCRWAVAQGCVIFPGFITQNDSKRHEQAGHWSAIDFCLKLMSLPYLQHNFSSVKISVCRTSFSPRIKNPTCLHPSLFWGERKELGYQHCNITLWGGGGLIKINYKKENCWVRERELRWQA